ncbi:hypothetical protein TNCV_4283161 [Trichonephila clavipes]|nr:hypothetical protein TNCV_4283161 [Trichonephila clavipes]
MQKGLEEIQKSQEETKNELREKMEKGQEDLRNTLEKKIDSVEEKIALKRMEDLEKKSLELLGMRRTEPSFSPASPVHLPSSAMPLTASPVSV